MTSKELEKALWALWCEVSMLNEHVHMFDEDIIDWNLKTYASRLQTLADESFVSFGNTDSYRPVY